MLEHDLKLIALLRMLEWRVSVDHDWAFAPGVYGRGLEQHLDREILDDVAVTYPGHTTDEIWTALFRLTELFRRLAGEVAAALGYAYPQEIDERMTSYLADVRDRTR